MTECQTTSMLNDKWLSSERCPEQARSYSWFVDDLGLMVIRSFCHRR
jgi:hypothetical protein